MTKQYQYVVCRVEWAVIDVVDYGSTFSPDIVEATAAVFADEVDAHTFVRERGRATYEVRRRLVEV